MATPIGERAITEAVRVGNAILKFISPNDVGLTGSHQRGYYLPKAVWEMFTPNAPLKGRNDDSEVTIVWQEGERTTRSKVKWYGNKSRNEYRLTCFGRDFPFLTADNVGELLVFIPEDHQHFLAYVLDTEEDIEEVQAALGVDITSTWAAFRNGVPQLPPENEDECIERRFRGVVAGLELFPAGSVFSEQTRAALHACVSGFEEFSADNALLRCMESEYRLFRLAERQICQPEIIRVFRDVDDFLATASSIMNRRKSRAGRSLENHVEYLLQRSHVPHVMRPNLDGKPDIVIPSAEAYRDAAYPIDKLIVVGVKTTCKDRWRQVLNEAKRIPHKHILTVQQGISSNQLHEMHLAGVTLIVPSDIQRQYPRERDISLLNVEQFIESVKKRLQQ
jgi:hypothetical protein